MKYFLPLLLVLCSCVSGRLAEANRASVEALGQVVVAEDPANLPVAQEAVDTAQAIVDASGVLAQLTSLGVPTELVDKNYQNVQLLSAKVVDATPEEQVVITRAAQVSSQLAGRAHTGANFISAAKKTPFLDQLLTALTAIGSGVGVIYASTRGRKHVAEWWNTPGSAPAEKKS